MKIIWVDMNASEGNPSMQHLVMSSEAFIADGLDIRLVCEKCQPSLESRVAIKMRELGIANVQSLVFSFRSIWLFLTRQREMGKDAIIHSTGANVIGADLISMHFIPADWLPMLICHGDKNWRDWLKVPIYLLAAFLEWIQRSLDDHSHFHVVSQSLGDSLVRKGIKPERITVIPTPYNAAKFHIEARHQHRDLSRAELGFKDSDIVFSFVSQGNYHRKGIRTAAKIVKLLRERGHPVHLLVIGGKGPSWQRMKDQLAHAYPESTAWLHITGFVPDLVHAMAASDAFLLPSLYEGFAAVEVEAAAMGLPLLLTSHPGVEMILKEDVNGWLIDHCPEKAAARIEQVIQRIRPFESANVGDAITLDVWQQRYKSLYRKLEAARMSGPRQVI